MVCTGLMRPIAGYLLFAPCGPLASKLSAREITLPLRTRRAAATMSSALVWFSVPTSSLGPQRPQFLNFSAAWRRSSRVSLRVVMAMGLSEGSEVRSVSGRGNRTARYPLDSRGRHVAPGFGERAIQVDRPAGIFDERDFEAGGARIERGPGDAEVGRQPANA